MSGTVASAAAAAVVVLQDNHVGLPTKTRLHAKGAIVALTATPLSARRSWQESGWLNALTAGAFIAPIQI